MGPQIGHAWWEQPLQQSAFPAVMHLPFGKHADGEVELASRCKSAAAEARFTINANFIMLDPERKLKVKERERSTAGWLLSAF